MIMATKDREEERTAASKKPDWSVGTNMKDEVARWDTIKRLWGEGELDLKEWDHIFTRGCSIQDKVCRGLCKNQPHHFPALCT